MSDTVTDRLAELENKKVAIEEAIETERLKQKFVEDENSIKKYFEVYAKADFEDEDIRNRVLEYFVDKIYVYNDRLVITGYYSDDETSIYLDALTEVSSSGTDKRAKSSTSLLSAPASSDNLKDWYVCREWNGEGKVTSYIKPEFEGHKIAGEYGDANDLHYAFIKSEYILYTITESGYADVYLDPSDGGAITVTTDGTATTDTIPKSMRVGITTQATDASGNDVGEETLKVVYAPYAETGKGNDKDAIDGWTCIAAEGSASKLKKVSYPYIYDTTYTDQNNKNWAATKNGDAYEVAEGTNPIATSVGYDGIKVRIYIWMEGTDADCVNNAAAEDTATYNVSVKFAGVPAGTSKAGTSTDSTDAQ